MASDCARYEDFMREAIGEANKAVLAGYRPFGAVCSCYLLYNVLPAVQRAVHYAATRVPATHAE